LDAYQVFCYYIYATNSFEERIKKGVPRSSLLPKKAGKHISAAKIFWKGKLQYHVHQADAHPPASN